VAESHISTESSPGRGACSSTRFDDIAGLRAISEVVTTLVCDRSGELSVGSGLGHVLLDDRPGCLGAIVAGDILRDGDTLGGTAYGALDGGDDVVNAQGANGTLEIGENFGDAEGVIGALVAVKKM
jgi:hypothetical protein